MAASTLWWLLAGALVAAELATGTFYLLVLGLAAALGALAAHLGLSPTWQVAVAGSVALLGTLAWAKLRKRRDAGGLAPEADRNLNLDIGETVQVGQWDAQGRTQVQHRGCAWSARYIGASPAAAGPHRIARIQGNQLELEPV